MLTVWLVVVPRIVHTVYTSVHSEPEKDYTLVVRMDGASMPHILRYAVLPNIAS